MNTKPTFARPRFVTTVAAALSCLIATGLLTAITEIFRRDGTPLEQVVIAERACTHHAFVSEQQTCVRRYLDASRVRAIASR